MYRVSREQEVLRRREELVRKKGMARGKPGEGEQDECEEEGEYRYGRCGEGGDGVGRRARGGGGREEHRPRPGRQGAHKDDCETGHRGRPRPPQKEHRERRSNEVVAEPASHQNHDTQFVIPSRPRPPSSSDRARDRPESPSPPRSTPPSRQKLDRHGKPLVKGGRGWKDAGPGPFPKYIPKPGLAMGLLEHIKDRYKWGVDNYHFEQRRKERRERRTLKERRAAKKGEKGKEKGRDEGENEEVVGKGDKRKKMTKREGKRPAKEGRRQDRELNIRHGPEAQESPASRKPRKSEHDNMHEGHGKRAPPAAEQECGRRHESRRDRPRKADVKGTKSHTGGSSVRSKTSKNWFSRREPVYKATADSRRVEARERVQVEGSKGRYRMLCSELLIESIIIFDI